MYVELHAHSAFSFLDGASLPDELVAAAVELGYEAFALTDHDGLCGSMEFAQAAAGLGLRAIHGAEMALEDGRHVTLLVEDATGWRNLCRIVTRAHAHDRDTGRAAAASVPFATLEEHAAGLVCLSGCARQGVHDEPGLRRLLRIFGADHLRVELQRPFHRDDRARNRAPRRAGRAARACRAWRRATSTRTPARGRRCRTPSSPCATTRRSTPRSPCAAATTPTCSPRRRRWRRASRTTRARSPRRARWPSG